jgi:hypothetical protein
VKNAVDAAANLSIARAGLRFDTPPGGDDGSIGNEMTGSNVILRPH